MTDNNKFELISICVFDGTHIIEQLTYTLFYFKQNPMSQDKQSKKTNRSCFLEVVGDQARADRAKAGRREGHGPPDAALAAPVAIGYALGPSLRDAGCISATQKQRGLDASSPERTSSRETPTASRHSSSQRVRHIQQQSGQLLDLVSSPTARLMGSRLSHSKRTPASRCYTRNHDLQQIYSSFETAAARVKDMQLVGRRMRTSLDSLPKVNGGADRHAAESHFFRQHLAEAQTSTNILGKDWIFPTEGQADIEIKNDYGIDEYQIVEEVVAGQPKGPSRFQLMMEQFNGGDLSVDRSKSWLLDSRTPALGATHKRASVDMVSKTPTRFMGPLKLGELFSENEQEKIQKLQGLARRKSLIQSMVSRGDRRFGGFQGGPDPDIFSDTKFRSRHPSFSGQQSDGAKYASQTSANTGTQIFKSKMYSMSVPSKQPRTQSQLSQIQDEYDSGLTDLVVINGRSPCRTKGEACSMPSVHKVQLAKKESRAKPTRAQLFTRERPRQLVAVVHQDAQYPSRLSNDTNFKTPDEGHDHDEETVESEIINKSKQRRRLIGGLRQSMGFQASPVTIDNRKKNHIAVNSCILPSNQTTERNGGDGRYSSKVASQQELTANNAMVNTEGNAEKELKVQNSHAKLNSPQQAVRTDGKEATAAVAPAPSSSPLSKSKVPTKKDLQARKIKEFAFQKAIMYQDNNRNAENLRKFQSGGWQGEQQQMRKSSLGESKRTSEQLAADSKLSSVYVSKSKRTDAQRRSLQLCETTTRSLSSPRTPPSSKPEGKTDKQIDYQKTRQYFKHRQSVVAKNKEYQHHLGSLISQTRPSILASRHSVQIDFDDAAHTRRQPKTKCSFKDGRSSISAVGESEETNIKSLADEQAAFEYMIEQMNRELIFRSCDERRRTQQTTLGTNRNQGSELQGQSNAGTQVDRTARANPTSTTSNLYFSALDLNQREHRLQKLKEYHKQKQAMTEQSNQFKIRHIPRFSNTFNKSVNTQYTDQIPKQSPKRSPFTQLQAKAAEQTPHGLLEAQNSRRQPNSPSNRSGSCFDQNDQNTDSIFSGRQTPMKHVKDLIINSCRVQEDGQLPHQIPQVSGERVIQLNDKAQRIQEHFENLGQIKEEFSDRHEELFLNRSTFVLANGCLSEMGHQRCGQKHLGHQKADSGDAKGRSKAGDAEEPLPPVTKEELARMVSLMDQIKRQRELDAQMVITRRDEAIRDLRPDYEELDAAKREQQLDLQKALLDEFGHPIASLAHIKSKGDKYQFRECYESRRGLSEMLEVDPSLAQALEEAPAEMKLLIGNLLASEANNIDIDYAKHFKESRSRGDQVQGPAKPNMLAIFAKTFKRNIGNVDTASIALAKALKNFFGKKSFGEAHGLVRGNMFENDFLARRERYFQVDPKCEQIPVQERNAEKQNLARVFTEQREKVRFYETAKNGRVDEQNPGNIDQIILSYYRRLVQGQDLPTPAYTQPQMECQTLHLNGMMMTDAMAQALRYFLRDTQNIKECQLRCLVINDTKMSREQFKEILAGVKEQGSRLTSFVCCNSVLYGSNLDELALLLPELADLCLKNMQFGTYKEECPNQGSKVPSSRTSHPSRLPNTFAKAIEQSSGKLLKLQLSKLDLGSDDRISQSLCEHIMSSTTTACYDISWAQLKPKHLKNIANALLKNFGRIRQLNLSYNALFFGDHVKEFKQGKPSRREQELVADSEQFMNSFLQYLSSEESSLLNHLNVSGMGFQPDQLRDLSKALTAKPNLLCIHLDDNGINQVPFDSNEASVRTDLLQIFGVTGDCGGSDRMPEMPCTRERIKEAIDKHRDEARASLVVDQEVIKSKDDFIKKKLVQALGYREYVNASLVSSGVGRIEDSSPDPFVLTRRVNHPELAFEMNNSRDFFAKDAQLRWSLNPDIDQPGLSSSPCYVCHRHQYLAIVYHQSSDPADNADLIEVKDAELLEDIRNWVKEQYTSGNRNICNAPIVLGSIVGNSFRQCAQMMRAELFALLLVSQAEKYAGSHEASEQLKDAVIEVANQGPTQTPKEARSVFEDKLDGWPLVLEQFMSENYLTDMMTVNAPTALFEEVLATKYVRRPLQSESKTLQMHRDKLARDKKLNQYFVYAGFVPPGPQQFLIYCPNTEKAYCKEILVDLNGFDQFPEYPPRVVEASLRI